MVKFVKVARKKTMLTLSIDGKEKWVTCTPQVLGYAKDTFKGGEDVDIQSEEGGELNLHVTRISKAGQGGSPQPTQTTKQTEVPTGFTCEVCGKALKTDKYKKCYTCNQKNPAPKKSGGNYGKSPEVQESILRQCVANATSRALNVLTGQIDLNTIGDAIDVIYDRILKKVRGE